jgi:hypothetical protein
MHEIAPRLRRRPAARRRAAGEVAFSSKGSPVPAYERQVDRHYDPVKKLLRVFTGK